MSRLQWITGGAIAAASTIAVVAGAGAAGADMTGAHLLVWQYGGPS